MHRRARQRSIRTAPLARSSPETNAFDSKMKQWKTVQILRQTDVVSKAYK